jgi:hypothetical protein
VSLLQAHDTNSAPGFVLQVSSTKNPAQTWLCGIDSQRIRKIFAPQTIYPDTTAANRSARIDAEQKCKQQ